MKILKLYPKFIKQSYKKMLAYKVDLVLNILSTICSQAFSLIFIYIIVGNVDYLNGWSVDEIIMLYGFYLIARGLDSMVSGGLLNIESHVVRGTLDKYLTKPISPILHILFEKVELIKVVNIIFGIGMLTVAINNSGFDFQIQHALLLMFLLIFSVLLLTLTKLIVMCIAFFTKTSFPITITVMDTSELSKYPINIFNNTIKSMFMFLIPFAFVSYFPIAVMLGREPLLETIFTTVCVTIMFFFIARYIWLKGLSKYDSAGS